jgi:monoamine oxidase
MRFVKPDLLGVARALAQDKRLDKAEVQLVLSLAGAEQGITALQREQLFEVLHRHKDHLEPDARGALRTFLDLDQPANRDVVGLAGRLSSDGFLDAGDVRQLLNLVRADSRVTAEERRALEAVLYGRKVIRPEARNLLSGFLATLPGETDALPSERGRSGRFATLVALRAASQAQGKSLALDVDRTPVALAHLRSILAESAAEGHLLVAMGVASPDERTLLMAGQMPLAPFYALAARGHFGDSADKPITYAAFRDVLLRSGLEVSWKRMMDDLPAEALERAKAGTATPLDIFAHQALTRAAWRAQREAAPLTRIVGDVARSEGLDALEKARELMSAAETKALESGQLSAAQVSQLMADATARDVDVLIIGGGMAGLAAAEKLLAQGKNVIVLEAGERLGGRTETNTTDFPFAYDVGAAWLHAAPENPLTPITERLGFHTVEDNLPQRARDGLKDETRQFLESKRRVEDAWRNAGLDGKDIPASQAMLLTRKWDGVAAGHLGPLHIGQDPERVSTKDFASQAEEKGDRFVTEGLGTVVSSFGHGVPVHLKTAVASVKWGPQGAEVKAWGGKIYRAKTLLCTASTAVMAANKIAFDPPLPEWKQDAFKNQPLASFNKIFLQFDADQKFGELKDGTHVRDLHNAEEALEFVIRPTGAPVVVGMVGGSFSEKLQEEGEAVAIEHALQRLEKMFPGVRKSFVNGKMTQWDSNPWMMGSFSSARPGYADGRKDIEKPVGQTLYFAGEAGDSVWAGCVPGSYLSGQRAARRIMERLAEGQRDVAKKGKKAA